MCTSCMAVYSFMGQKNVHSKWADRTYREKKKKKRTMLGSACQRAFRYRAHIPSNIPCPTPPPLAPCIPSPLFVESSIWKLTRKSRKHCRPWRHFCFLLILVDKKTIQLQSSTNKPRSKGAKGQRLHPAEDPFIPAPLPPLNLRRAPLFNRKHIQLCLVCRRLVDIDLLRHIPRLP